MGNGITITRIDDKPDFGPPPTHTLICLPASLLTKTVWIPGAEPVGPDCQTRAVMAVASCADALSAPRASAHALPAPPTSKTREEKTPEKNEREALRPLTSSGLHAIYQELGWATAPRPPVAEKAADGESPGSATAGAHRWDAWCLDATRAGLGPVSYEPLSYDVYTPERLASWPGKLAAHKSVPVPAAPPQPRSVASLALHLGVLVFGVGVALATVLAVVAVSGSDPSGRVVATEALVARPVGPVPPEFAAPIDPPARTLIGVSAPAGAREDGPGSKPRPDKKARRKHWRTWNASARN